MSFLRNVTADDGSLLKNNILKTNKSSPELSLAAGLPNITHIPLHLDLDWSSDTTDFSLSTPQSKVSSSVSLPAVIEDTPSSISLVSRRRMDFNATRPSPGPRGALEGDYNMHDESPFEAARRAQQKVETAEDRPPMNDSPYIPGQSRFPSIKPGEIVPHHLIWISFEPPAFLPPLEAPPFPPDVHPIHPIRPAHFPGSTYQPPNLHRTTSQSQVPYPSPSPTPAQNTSSVYQLPSSHDSHPSENHASTGPRLHPSRVASPAYSSRSAPVPVQVHPPPPPPLVRSNTDVLREIPHELRPNDGQRPKETLIPLSIPRGPPPPQLRTAPPTRGPSQRPFERPHLPPTREALQFTNSLPPPRPTGHQPHTPSPLHLDFVPASANPVRLPSENFRMTQSEHGHDVSDSRFTPKPVMPRPLAALAHENYRSGDEKGSADLKRSVSSVPSKGGFLSRTKSLLRKRTSTSTIRLNTDGSIGLSHDTLSTLTEEKRPTSNKLLKKK